MQHLKQLSKVKKGVTRPTGIHVRAKCDKNKVGLPYRECEFDIMFGFGVDSLCASLEWLDDVKRLDVLDDLNDVKLGTYIKRIEALPDKEYRAKIKYIDKKVEQVWKEIEDSFLPARKKY